MRALGDDARLPDEQVAARVRALGPRSIGHAVLGRLAGHAAGGARPGARRRGARGRCRSRRGRDARRDRRRGGPDSPPTRWSPPRSSRPSGPCASLIPSSDRPSTPTFPWGGARTRTRARLARSSDTGPTRTASSPISWRPIPPATRSAVEAPPRRGRAGARTRRPGCRDQPARASARRAAGRRRGAGRSCSSSVTRSAGRGVSTRPRATCARR